jgi:hypothetical protein
MSKDWQNMFTSVVDQDVEPVFARGDLLRESVDSLEIAEVNLPRYESEIPMQRRSAD